MRTLSLALLLTLFVWAAPCARAGEPVWATGRIVDSHGRPIADAQVAVYDDSNKVVDTARTDRDGEYAVALPEHVLHLRHRHGKGFITSVFNGITRFVGGATGFVANPARAGLRAVTSGEAAIFSDPLTKGEIAAGGAVADQVLFGLSPREKKDSRREERKLPGSVFLKVVAPDRNDLTAVTQVYWLQEEQSENGRKKRTLAAWLDPIEMSPTDSDRPSHVRNDYLRFSSARLVPGLTEPGERVRILATLPEPPDPSIEAIVVARDYRTGQKWQLQPMGDGRYEGEIWVDKRFPRDDHVISILAYAEKERKPGRSPEAEGEIERAGLWDPKKPYIYDPLLVVSRNRADLTLTVVEPRKRRR